MNRLLIMTEKNNQLCLYAGGWHEKRQVNVPCLFLHEYVK